MHEAGEPRIKLFSSFIRIPTSRETEKNMEFSVVADLHSNIFDASSFFIFMQFSVNNRLALPRPLSGWRPTP